MEMSNETRITGFIGGQPKQRYFTPDGKVVEAMPDIHEFTTRGGKNGVRDANLDKGWLLQAPTELKPSCEHCGGWHDTQDEIEQCKVQREDAKQHWVKKAQSLMKETPADTNRLSRLEDEMSQIKALLEQLVGDK